MQFSSLISDTPIIDQWVRDVDAARVPSAVLLTGASGSELLALALALIGYLQCTDRGTGDSCGVCPACRQGAKLTHPDVHFTFPVVGSGVTSAQHLGAWREAVLANLYLDQGEWLRAQTNDNKQGNINRDEVMRILHDLSLQRFTDGHKVVVIWGADYLGDESNRLLKVIEEPPTDTLILLLTSRLDRILPTIVSRCRVLRLPYPSPEALAGLLVKRGVDPARAQDLAYASGADIGLALAEAAADGAGEREDKKAPPTVAAWLRACFAGKGAPIVLAANRLAALTREQQKHFLLRALRFVRELGVARVGTPMPLRLGPADAHVATKLADLVEWSQLTALADEIDRLYGAVERNANGKIAFAASSVRIHHILAPQRRAS